MALTTEQLATKITKKINSLFKCYHRGTNKLLNSNYSSASAMLVSEFKDRSMLNDNAVSVAIYEGTMNYLINGYLTYGQRETFIRQLTRILDYHECYYETLNNYSLVVYKK